MGLVHGGAVPCLGEARALVTQWVMEGDMPNDNDVFSPEQVVALWHWQFRPAKWVPGDAGPPPMHPFTCPDRGTHPELEGDKGILVPTTRGWICPFCAYTQ